MKKILSAIALALTLAATSGTALAAIATWNGDRDNVTTVTNQQAIRCGYNVLGETIHRVFLGNGMCPYTINVQ